MASIMKFTHKYNLISKQVTAEKVEGSTTLKIRIAEKGHVFCF